MTPEKVKQMDTRLKEAAELIEEYMEDVVSDELHLELHKIVGRLEDIAEGGE